MRQLVLYLLLFLQGLLFAQESVPITDTLARARELAYAGRFEAAAEILETFNTGKDDLEGLRLYAQVLFWKGEPANARKVYERTITAFPQEPVLKLEYGTLQFETGRLNHAYRLLRAYLETDIRHIQARTMLAWLEHWNGREARARGRALGLLAEQPDNEHAVDLLREINEFTSPYLGAEGLYQTDDQPLKNIQSHLWADWYKSWLLAPVVDYRLFHFHHRTGINPAHWVQVANRFYYGPTRTRLNLQLGYIGQVAGSSITAGGAITQSISRWLNFEGKYAYTPYHFTLLSVTQYSPLMYYDGEVALVLDHREKWLGKAARAVQFFGQEETVSADYAWLLVPLLHKRAIELKIGYGYSTTSSDSLSYCPVFRPNGTYTVNPDGSIPGVYDPYFSPFNQRIHMGLASLRLKTGKVIDWHTRFSYGFSATADNPYLYEDLNQHLEVFVNHGFYEETFTPLVVESTLQLKVSPRILASVQYGYERLFFYEMHRGALLLQYQFLNETKR